MQPTITRAERVADMAQDEQEAQITARGPDGREREVFLTVESRSWSPGVLVIRNCEGRTVWTLDLSLFPATDRERSR